MQKKIVSENIIIFLVKKPFLIKLEIIKHGEIS